MVELGRVHLTLEEQRRIIDEERFRLPVSEKCALRLGRGPPCDRTGYSAWLMCFAWNRIRGVSGDLTLKEVFHDALVEAKTEFIAKCEKP